VLLIIIDNAFNNNTLLNVLNQKLKKSVNEIFSTDIIRILYLAHVLLNLIRPFIFYINVIGKTRDPTIHNIFKIYDYLFNYIEIAIDRL
jgi:hypothetical protein